MLTLGNEQFCVPLAVLPHNGSNPLFANPAYAPDSILKTMHRVQGQPRLVDFPV